MSKKIKKVFVWLAVIAVLAAGAFLILRNKKQQVGYKLIPVESGTIIKTVSADGKYLSKEEANLSFRVTGPVTGIDFDTGDEVKKGQVIARVDTGILEEQLKQAQAAVTTQKQTLAAMKREAHKVEEKNAQRGVIKSAEGAVDAILAQIPYAVLRSPMDGTVAEKNINLGEIATAGNPVLTIIREDEMRIEAKIPEVEIAGIRKGQEAEIKFDAYPEDQRFLGTVSEIDPTPITAENVSYYIAKIEVSNPDPGFKYGMKCTVYVELDRKENVLMIPKWTVEKENDKKFVSILTDAEENTIEKRKIQTGIEGDNGMVEVVSGLDKNDQLATEM